MLPYNFIYAYSKESFLRELDAGNIQADTIVFIGDTKEIWNNGTFFAGVKDIPFEKGEGTDSAVQKNQWGANTAGNNAFASGFQTTASGDQAHTEGYMTQATAKDTHAEGHSTVASDHAAHAEGYETVASGWGSHSEGLGTEASGHGSHAEGGTYTDENNITHKTVASDDGSHAEGLGTTSSSKGSHSEGEFTTASGQASHAEGSETTASGWFSHAEGQMTSATGFSAHAEGFITIADADDAHAEGTETKALGASSHSEGDSTTASADNSHAEGCGTTASGWGAHTEGYSTTASGSKAHAEGDNTVASGENSHAEGNYGKARGYASHVEGNSCTASGAHSHAEGYQTKATREDAHVEGHLSESNEHASHAEGYETKANGWATHTEGIGTTATNHNGEHAEGKYNKSNTGTIHSVGIGSSTDDRKNAHEIMQDGKHYILNVGGYDGTNPDKATDVASQLTELSEEISKKQGTITDLEEIRSGAEKGATAIQEVKTINGQSLLGKGDIVIEGGGESYDDTEIRDELAKLSEDVSGLSERVDELDQPIFEAKYLVTTFKEIVNARNEGKLVIMIKDQLIYHLSYISDTLAHFAAIDNYNISYYAYIQGTNRWFESSKTLEKASNKITSLTDESTDEQYPSAKAVYDAIQDVEEELNNKQESLVDGQNIKTVNGQSILGEGNIVIDTYDDSEIQQKLTEVIDAVDNLSSIDHTTYAEKEEVYDKTTTDGLLMNLKEFTLLETKDLLDKLAEELNQKINILADISDSDFSKDFERNNDFSMDFNNL